jgi:hypothetical protein
VTPSRRATALVGLALVGLVAAGCDHRSALLVENQTDSDFIVRTTGTNYTSEAGNYRDQVVAIAPANSKRVVVFYGFTGGFRSNDLEILRPDCSPIYSQPFYGDIGSYVVIDDDAKVTIRREYPEEGDSAAQTTACRTMPVASPSARPTPTPIPTAMPERPIPTDAAASG